MTIDLDATAVPSAVEGTNVMLRAFRPGDGHVLFEAAGDKLPLTVSEIGSIGLLQAERAVLRWALDFAGRERMYFGVWEKPAGRLAGYVGLEGINWCDRSFYIGYWLRPSARGKGLMSDAVQALCLVAFGPLEGSCVRLVIDARNERSVALARRLGFVMIGTLPSEDEDAIVFQLTAPMFAAAHQTPFTPG